jgi:hypothetical protein
MRILKQRDMRKEQLTTILTDLLPRVELQQGPQDSDCRNKCMISNPQICSLEGRIVRILLMKMLAKAILNTSVIEVFV